MTEYTPDAMQLAIKRVKEANVEGLHGGLYCGLANQFTIERAPFRDVGYREPFQSNCSYKVHVGYLPLEDSAFHDVADEDFNVTDIVFTGMSFRTQDVSKNGITVLIDPDSVQELVGVVELEVVGNDIVKMYVTGKAPDDKLVIEREQGYPKRKGDPISSEDLLIEMYEADLPNKKHRMYWLYGVRTAHRMDILAKMDAQHYDRWTVTTERARLQLARQVVEGDLEYLDGIGIGQVLNVHEGTIYRIQGMKTADRKILLMALVESRMSFDTFVQKLAETIGFEKILNDVDAEEIQIAVEDTIYYAYKHS